MINKAKHYIYAQRSNIHKALAYLITVQNTLERYPLFMFQLAVLIRNRNPGRTIYDYFACQKDEIKALRVLIGRALTLELIGIYFEVKKT